MNDYMQKKCREGFQKKLNANYIISIKKENMISKISSKISQKGGSNKIKNFPKSKISQIEGGSSNLGTFPKLYLWLIMTASLGCCYYYF